MNWEQEITELLQQAQSIAVRFDVRQELTEAQKSRARNNIGVTVTATEIATNEYRLAFNY